MNEEKNAQVSGNRMRIGVVCLVLWWVPFWALAPMIASNVNVKTSVVTIVIIAVQTTLGALGIWVAGKEVSNIIKKTPNKQVPSKVWHVLIRGSFN